MSGYNTRNRKDTDTFADLIELFDEKLKKIVTKEDINELKEMIENQKKKIDKQQIEIESLQTKVRHLENNNKSLEQYGRRTCLRLIDIPPPENGNENSKDCLKKVLVLIEHIVLANYSKEEMGQLCKRLSLNLPHGGIKPFFIGKEITKFARIKNYKCT